MRCRIHSPTQWRALGVEWLTSSNVVLSSDIGFHLNSHGTICMDLCNRKRTIVGQLQFGLTCHRPLNHHLLSNGVVQLSASCIFMQEMAVNLILAQITQSEHICNERDVEVHVTSKCQSTRGYVIQGVMGRASTCKHCSVDQIIDYMISICFILNILFEAFDSCNNGNCLVTLLNDSIGLRIDLCHGLIFNSCSIKHSFEVTFELRAIVMHTSKWPRVS